MDVTEITDEQLKEAHQLNRHYTQTGIAFVLEHDSFAKNYCPTRLVDRGVRAGLMLVCMRIVELMKELAQLKTGVPMPPALRAVIPVGETETLKLTAQFVKSGCDYLVQHDPLTRGLDPEELEVRGYAAGLLLASIRCDVLLTKIVNLESEPPAPQPLIQGA